MGRMERPHKQLPVIAQRAADLPPSAGGSQPVGAQLHQVMAASDIAACGGNTAAWVLDQGAGDNIRAHRQRLFPLYKLSITVVHHDNGVGGLALGDLHNGGNVLHPEGRPQAIATGTLDVNHPVLRSDTLLHGLQIRGAIGTQGKLFILDTELFQAARLFPALHADDPLDSVIRGAGDAQHFIPGTQHPKQGHGQGMGTTDEIVAHQGVFRPKGIGVHFVQHIPATISIAIACAADKVALADTGPGESRQHFLLVVPLDGFDFLKAWPGGGFSLFRRLQQLRRDLKSWIDFHG